jgi:DNA repair exonuclease SbcCD ATPase subunit
MAEFTETELLRQRLADAEAKVEELTTEVGNLEDELEQFQQQITKARAETASVKAGMGVAVMNYRHRAEKAESDLAQFYQCVDSSSCRDTCGRVHIHDTAEFSFVDAPLAEYSGEATRVVYHKVDE